jgi:hypothetical protein
MVTEKDLEEIRTSIDSLVECFEHDADRLGAVRVSLEERAEDGWRESAKLQRKLRMAEQEIDKLRKTCANLNCDLTEANQHIANLRLENLKIRRDPLIAAHALASAKVPDDREMPPKRRVTNFSGAWCCAFADLKSHGPDRETKQEARADTYRLSLLFDAVEALKKPEPRYEINDTGRGSPQWEKVEPWTLERLKAEKPTTPFRQPDGMGSDGSRRIESSRCP